MATLYYDTEDNKQKLQDLADQCLTQIQYKKELNQQILKYFATMLYNDSPEKRIGFFKKQRMSYEQCVDFIYNIDRNLKYRRLNVILADNHIVVKDSTKTLNILMSWIECENSLVGQIKSLETLYSMMNYAIDNGERGIKFEINEEQYQLISMPTNDYHEKTIRNGLADIINK